MLNQHLRRQMRDYQAPDIMEYIHIKDKRKKLQQSIHTWERRVGIAQVSSVLFSSSKYNQLSPGFSVTSAKICSTCIIPQSKSSAGGKRLCDSIQNNGPSIFCFRQMALKTHAKAWNRPTLTPAYSTEAGAKSAEYQTPVKLPYISENST